MFNEVVVSVQAWVVADPMNAAAWMIAAIIVSGWFVVVRR